MNCLVCGRLVDLKDYGWRCKIEDNEGGCGAWFYDWSLKIGTQKPARRTYWDGKSQKGCDLPNGVLLVLNEEL